MDGYLTMSSKEHCGSTFSFVLSYKVSPISDDHSNDVDELPYRSDHNYALDDIVACYFQFQLRTLGGAYTFPSGTTTSKEMASLRSACDEADAGYPSSDSLSKKDMMSEDTRGVLDDKPTNGVGSQAENSSMYHVSKEVSELVNMNKPQEACQVQKGDRILKSVSCGNLEVTQSVQRLKILLLEDNKINVVVTRSMTKHLGHVIDVVNNGVEVVRAVQSHSYDLILMVTTASSIFTFHKPSLTCIASFQ
ncbi:hypothetical protein Ancab_019987 [Ancistrocladus abbreviatus]